MTAVVFDDLDELLAAAPLDLGVTGWMTLDEAMIDAFRKSTSTPPAIITPPLLVLSLTNRFLPELILVPAASSGVNYGTGRVRFDTPVEAGSRLRGAAHLLDSAEVSGGVQTTVRVVVEVDGAERPACVADSFSRWLR